MLAFLWFSLLPYKITHWPDGIVTFAGFVTLYCLTSCVGGFISVRLYRQMNGKDWTRCIFLTATLFPFPVFCYFMWVNTIATLQGSPMALPFTTVLTVSALVVLTSLTFTIVGGFMAKQFVSSDDFNAPTRTTEVTCANPKQIPFYCGRLFQSIFRHAISLLVSGCLPIAVISSQQLRYVVFVSKISMIWTLVLLVVYTSFITVAFVYFQLVRDDHRWWWTAYINGGMPGLYIFIYLFCYCCNWDGCNLSGYMLTVFSYIVIFSLALFLALGSAAFQFSSIFVKYIYSRIKRE